MNINSASALVQLYVDKYQAKHGRKPKDLNRNKASWEIFEIGKDYTITEIKELIEYYFRTGGNHDWHTLVYNYPEIFAIMEERRKDEERRRKLLEETRHRVERDR